MNSANEIWLSITPVLQENFTDIAFKTWFGEVEPLDFQMDKLILSCPSDFKAKMINERFRPNITNILKDLFSADIDVAVLGPDEAEGLPICRRRKGACRQSEHPHGQ